MAILSIMGLYNYDNTIFDGLSLPVGGKVLKSGEVVPPLDKEVLINNILVELAELEFLYPQPELAKQIISVWSKSQIRNWEKLHETTFLEYELLHNYDRTEDITDTETVTRNVDIEGVTTIENSGNNSSSGNNSATATNNGTNTKSNSAYNNSALYENEKNIISDNSSNSGNFEDSGSFSNNGTNTDSRNSSETATRTNNHSVRVFGNIGVTTSQQMITEERKLLKFDIYSYITQQFKERFCICVY